MTGLVQQLESPAAAPPQPGHRTRARWMGGAAALWLFSGFYAVMPDQQAVETIFGKLTEPRVMPGLHYAPPWPIGSVTKLKVRQMQRLIIGGDAAGAITGRSEPGASQFVTGDQNIIQLRTVVQYSVSTPAEYLFETQDPGRAVGAIVESELAKRVARRGVDAVLTTEKAAIQEEVRAASQAVLNRHRVGALLSSINIESAAPPPEATDAFRDVASARADGARIVNDAQGYANDLLPKSRGQAQQLLEEAEAYRQRKINEASGDAARFNQVAAEYSKAAQVTSHRLYVETMEQVLPRIRKLILDRNGNLDLTIIRKGDVPAQK
jgi:membrane protease subunit HflK